MPLYPTFTTLAAELGDSLGRSFQKVVELLQKAPISGTALASATRSATTITGDISNAKGCRGVIVYLNVTAASGTGGLTPRLFGVEPTTNTVATIASAATAATTVGTRIYHFGPGVGGVNGATIAWGGAGVMLGGRFQIQVLHGDASNYTYSVTYELIA